MALIETMSNTLKRYALEAVSGDSYFMSLMSSGFVFDKDNHATYTDVSGEELPAGDGYTGSGESMSVSGEVLEDDGNDRARLKFLDTSFNATSGEDFGPASAAIIWDQTASGEMVCGCIDFGASYQISGEFTIEGFTIELN